MYSLLLTVTGVEGQTEVLYSIHAPVPFASTSAGLWTTDKFLSVDSNPGSNSVISPRSRSAIAGADPPFPPSDRGSHQTAIPAAAPPDDGSGRADTNKFGAPSPGI